MFQFWSTITAIWQICGRRLLLPLMALGALTLMIMFAGYYQQTTLYQQTNLVYQCYMEADSPKPDAEDSSLISLEDVLLSNAKPTPGRTIFFLETSCHRPDTQYNMVNLKARQACSIESAALHNPNFQVFVLFANPNYRLKSEPIMDSILSYKNVKFRQLNIRRYAIGTPIEDWVKAGNLFHSKYLVEHTSDLLRLISLYHFGGIYLDMDVVVLRSLEYVPLNYVGAHDDRDFGNAVISLESRGIGHEIAEMFLRDYQQHFSGTTYVQNGPSLIKRVVTKMCNTTIVKEMQDNPERCQGLQVFNSSAFFPLPWQHWKDYFEPEKMVQTKFKTKDAYLIHLWNKASYQGRIKVGSSTAYGKYAEQHCPKTYAAAGEYF